MTYQPLVTIVTPAYDQAGYIRRCVESVLAQTYPRWELIVVDDGSTDGTPDVVEAYGDPRIRCIRLPHRGLAALAETYNAALSRSSGELVAILEGDDLWPAHKLALQVPAFEDGVRRALLRGAGNLVDESDRVIETVRRVECAGDRRAFSTRGGAAAARARQLPHALRHGDGPARRARGHRRVHAARLGLFVDLPTWLRLAARLAGLLRVPRPRPRRLAPARVADHRARTSCGCSSSTPRWCGSSRSSSASPRSSRPASSAGCSARARCRARTTTASSRSARAGARPPWRRHADALKRAASWKWRKRAALGALSAVCGVDLTGIGLRAGRG